MPNIVQAAPAGLALRVTAPSLAGASVSAPADWTAYFRCAGVAGKLKLLGATALLRTLGGGTAVPWKSSGNDRFTPVDLPHFYNTELHQSHPPT